MFRRTHLWFGLYPAFSGLSHFAAVCVFVSHRGGKWYEIKVSFGVVTSCQILLKMYSSYFPETFLNALGYFVNAGLKLSVETVQYICVDFQGIRFCPFGRAVCVNCNVALKHSGDGICHCPSQRV